METKKSILDRADDKFSKWAEAGLYPKTYVGPMNQEFLTNISHLKKNEIAKAHLYSHILAQGLYMSLDAWTRRNNNIMVFGGSGTGKSRYVVKPNMLNMNGSFVVTDPSGELLATMGKALENNGYHVKVLNVSDTEKSNRYNPFAYIKKVDDIPILVNNVIDNLGGKSGGSNAFWDDAVTNLLNAIFGYLFEAYPIEQRTFANVNRLLRMMDMDAMSKDPNYVSPIDILFNDWKKKVEETGGHSYACAQWSTFKQSMGETQSNILISTGVKISTIFDVEGLANLTCRDEMELERVGKEKTAVFLIIPVGNTTYNFLTSMVISQLFSIMYQQGEDKMKAGKSSPKLDVHVDFIIDEIANVGKIRNLDLYMSTVRKYDIGVIPIWQAVSQMKDNKDYEKMADTLIGNCDVLIYLGGTDPKTTEFVSKLLGKMTIDEHTQAITKKAKTPDINVSKKARDVMTTDELGRLPGDECIICIRGTFPFHAKKYELTKHPNYYMSGDADEKHNSMKLNNFDMTIRQDGVKGVEYVLYKINPKTGKFVVKKNKETGARYRVPVATFTEWDNTYAIRPPEYEKNDKGEYVNENGYPLKYDSKSKGLVAYDPDDNGKVLPDEPKDKVMNYVFPDPDDKDFGGAYVPRGLIDIEAVLGVQTEFSKKNPKQGKKAVSIPPTVPESASPNSEPIAPENASSPPNICESSEPDLVINEENENKNVLSDEEKRKRKEKIESATTENDVPIGLADLKNIFIPLSEYDAEFETVSDEINKSFHSLLDDDENQSIPMEEPVFNEDDIDIPDSAIIDDNDTEFTEESSDVNDTELPF